MKNVLQFICFLLVLNGDHMRIYVHRGKLGEKKNIEQSKIG